MMHGKIYLDSYYLMIGALEIFKHGNMYLLAHSQLKMGYQPFLHGLSQLMPCKEAKYLLVIKNQNLYNI